MKVSISIECRGADAKPYTELANLQGDLKVLSEESYQRFKLNLIKNGFSEPIAIWNDGEKLRIVNGHQRVATVKRMVENEGYSVGELPISYVFAQTYQEAKEKALALTSEYGEITQQGLVNFLMDVQIDADYLRDVANIKNVNMDEVLSQLGSVKLDSLQADPLDVGTMIVGDNNLPMGEPQASSRKQVLDETPKNDVMSGLRLYSNEVDESIPSTDFNSENIKLRNSDEDTIYLKLPAGVAAQLRCQIARVNKLLFPDEKNIDAVLPGMAIQIICQHIAQMEDRKVIYLDKELRRCDLLSQVTPDSKLN